jgi:hypothetical protein
MVKRPDHGESQMPLSTQHFRHPAAASEQWSQIGLAQPQLLHAKTNRIACAWRFDRLVCSLIEFNERDPQIQIAALRRAWFGVDQLVDSPKRQGAVLRVPNDPSK